MDTYSFARHTVRASDIEIVGRDEDEDYTVVLSNEATTTTVHLVVHTDCADKLRKMANDLDAIAASGQASDPRRI